MAEKAYIVMQGDYSDKHIEAVFLAKDDAVTYIINHRYECRWNSMRIEEYPIGKCGRATNKQIYYVTCNEQGLWQAAETNEYEYEMMDKYRLRSERVPGRNKLTDVKWTYRNYIIARDKMIALKIAQDDAARLKAERIERGEW